MMKSKFFICVTFYFINDFRKIAYLVEFISNNIAIEEYTEAKLLYFAITGKEIDKIKKLNLSTDAYLGGICDLLGELVRVATNDAAAGNFNRVAEIKELAENIMDQLIDFDMTGYLRTKYDQARGHLRKLEQMAYEIKLRVGE